MHRRQVLATLGSIGLAGCTSRLPSIGSSQTDPLPGEGPNAWAQFGRTAAHPGRNTDVTIDDPQVRWQTTLPGGVTVPAVVGDTVYVSGGVYTEENERYPAGGVFALDRETGTQRWQTTLPALGGGFAGCPPTIHNGSVYVGNAGEGDVHALDARTGEKRWQLDLGESVNEPIAAAGDRVCFVQQEAVIAVDTLGEERWRYTKKDHVFLGAPAVANGTAYVGSVYIGEGNEDDDDTTSVLVAIKLETGEVLWEKAHGEGFHSLVVDGGVLYATDTRAVYAVKAATGEQKWRHLAEELGLGRVAVSDDTVFVTGGRELVALSRADGRERWRFEVEGEYLRTTPVVIDGAVVATTERPQRPRSNVTTYAFDVATGNTQWTHKLPGNMGHTPAAFGDALYLPVYQTGSESTLIVIESST